jgi:hypothetical protein
MSKIANPKPAKANDSKLNAAQQAARAASTGAGATTAPNCSADVHVGLFFDMKCFLTRFFCLLFSICFSAAAFAQVNGKNDHISASDFQAVAGAFSKGACDVPLFLRVSKGFGFKAVWLEYDGLEEWPMSDLDADVLCLMALSSAFQAYEYKTLKGEMVRRPVGPVGYFPPSASVSEIDFFAPKSLVPKRCVGFKGATVPFVITISKVDGKLHRVVRKMDADESCFVAAIKQKGLGLKN